MERKIGETFEYEGKKLQVVETANNLCFDCYFFDGVNCQRTEREGGECSDSKRADYKPVIFVEVKDEQPQELNLCEILKDCPKGEKFWSPMLGAVKLHDIIQSEDIIIIEAKNRETWEINSDGTINIGDIISPEIMLYPSKEQRDWTKVKYEKKKEKFDPKTLSPFDRVLSKYDGGCWSANLFSHIEEENNKYHGTCSFVCNGSLVKFCIPYNDDTKHLVDTKDEAPDFYKYWED